MKKFITTSPGVNVPVDDIVLNNAEQQIKKK